MAQSWYYARGNQQFGPVTIEQLLGLLSTGQVQHADLVWTEGMAQWSPAQSVPELASKPAPPPMASAPVMPNTYQSNPYATNPAALNPGVAVAFPDPALRAAPWPAQQSAPGALGYQSVYGQEQVYAGFWLRFAAYIIDYIITYVAGLVGGFIIGFMIALAAGQGGD